MCANPSIRDEYELSRYFKQQVPCNLTRYWWEGQVSNAWYLQISLHSNLFVPYPGVVWGWP
jgi:hypothetical protein